MSRKSFVLAIAIVLALFGGSGGILLLLAHYEPLFYKRAALPPGEHRQKCSGDFVAEFTNHVLVGILNNDQWDARFTEEQINSYFAEDFLSKHSAENPLPQGISEPRFSIETERIRLGFRYGSGAWTSIISLDLHVWLVPKEPNLVAVELQALHAGALPISAQSLLERVAEAAKQLDIDPTWYRYHGHPVLLLRFQAHRPSPTFQLQQLELRDKMLRIVGGPLESAPRAALPADGRGLVQK
jgi:hypothetical protein